MIGHVRAIVVFLLATSCLIICENTTNQLRHGAEILPLNQTLPQSAAPLSPIDDSIRASPQHQDGVKGAMHSLGKRLVKMAKRSKRPPSNKIGKHHRRAPTNEEVYQKERDQNIDFEKMGYCARRCIAGSNDVSPYSLYTTSIDYFCKNKNTTWARFMEKHIRPCMQGRCGQHGYLHSTKWFVINCGDF